MWHGIYGHERVVDYFRRSLASGRLGSSYLFLGPPGVGKFTFARKLAQALLCLNSAESPLEPCGQCDSCRLMDSSGHPDLNLIGLPEGKNRLPVELFVGDRDHRHQEGLCHDIALRPRLSRRRVAIIDDADHLNTESANSLLKTLEEPPRGAILILIGTSRSRQLPTILSRAQVVPFDPLPTDAIAALLQNLEIASDPSHASTMAARCAGSLSRAYELADPELCDLEQRLATQMLPAAFDSVRLAAELIAVVNQAGKDAYARRQRLRAVLQMASMLFRSILRGACGAAEEHADPECKAVKGWLELGPAVENCALAALDRCLEAEEQLDRNANQATLIECWLDDLAEVFSRVPAFDARATIR